MNTIIWLIVCPLLIAFSLPLLNLYLKKIYKAVIISSGFIICLLSINLLLKTLKSPIVYSLGSWEVTSGINLVADPLTGILIALIGLISLLIIIYSLVYIKENEVKYYTLFLIIIAGLNGMILTGDLFNLFVFLEIVSLASYALVAFRKTPKAYEASFKYMVIGSLGSFFILLAIILIYQQTGTLNLGQLIIEAESITGVMKTGLLFLLLIGFGSKFALVPLHTWLPDAHPAAPASISALLSGVVIKAYLYAWLRILMVLFDLKELLNFNLPTILIYLGVLTLFVGHLLAYQQKSLKRLLAYSSISQIGYIMIGIGTLNQTGIIGGLFHVINHALVKVTLFLAAGIFSKKIKLVTISDLKGLAYKTPIMAFMFTIASLIIIGLPPFNVFISKWLIAKAAIKSGFIIPGGSILIGSILALTYYLKVIKLIYTREEKASLLNIDWKFKLPVITLLITCLIIGIVPGFILNILEQGVVYLLDTQLYYQILFAG